MRMKTPKPLAVALALSFAMVAGCEADIPDPHATEIAELTRAVGTLTASNETLGKELSAMARKGEWQDMPKRVPDSLMDEVAVIGKPAEIPVKLAERYRGLLDRVSLYFPIPARDATEKWRAFAKSFRGADGATT